MLFRGPRFRMLNQAATFNYNQIFQKEGPIRRCPFCESSCPDADLPGLLFYSKSFVDTMSLTFAGFYHQADRKLIC